MHQVITVAPIQIITTPAIRISRVIPDQDIAAGAAIQPVVPQPTIQRIVTVVAIELIVTRTAQHEIGASQRMHQIVVVTHCWLQGR